MEKRKGAKSIKEIPVAVLNQLQNGTLETANLVEWLAIDQALLLKNVLEKCSRTSYEFSVSEAIQSLKKQTVNTINETIGSELHKQAVLHNDFDLKDTLSNHLSDVVRCWACYFVAKTENQNIAEKLNEIAVFASDAHFGVREISWMAVRADITANLSESIAILSKWTSSTDENIRRFASEATRPRGVWCAHINDLKTHPDLAIAILEPLKSDPTKYVQNSIANWLNDASKTQPQFVMDICTQWQKESASKETAYIVKRALRSIDKK